MGKIGAIWRTALGWLTLGGRLLAAQPWALAAGASAILLGALFPSRWLLFIVYAYLLLLLLSYLWVRALGPRLRLRRQLTTAAIRKAASRSSSGPLPAGSKRATLSVHS